MGSGVELKVGDDAWFHNGGDDNPLVKGMVVHIFFRYGRKLYVIERPSHIDSTYEVRDPFTVSESPNKPIGLWRELRRTIQMQELWEVYWNKGAAVERVLYESEAVARAAITNGRDGYSVAQGPIKVTLSEQTDNFTRLLSE